MGSFWHKTDARTAGFTPQSPGTTPGIFPLISHIARGTVTSPYISLTRSYGVACDYALVVPATKGNPAYVYQVEIDDPVPGGLALIDPVKELGAHLPGPLQSMSYQHDGNSTFLLGVVDPNGHEAFLQAPRVQPPPGGGARHPASLTPELEALVRALRDAEILAVGNIPASCVRRDEVW